ncbi:MAG: hypothetical protein ACI4UM_04560 [Succinivibrio sp.]
MSVNSVNSSQSAFQIIQSNTNRQRIDEQNRQSSQENSSTQAVSLTSNHKEERFPSYRVEAASEADNTYSNIRQEFFSRKGKSSSILAYTDVRDQENREQISNRMGISVYA